MPPDSGGWDLPFEASDGELFDIAEATLAGSITVLATVVDVPELGSHPGLVFRFGLPDGSLAPPILLVLDDEHMLSTATLVQDAVAAAVASSQQRHP